MINFYSLLTKEEKQLLTVSEYSKGQILFHEDELCQLIGIVVKGSVSISSYTLMGNEIVYNSIQEGSIFGHNLVFSNHPYYRGNVIANQNVAVALIKKDDFLNVLKTNTLFLNEYLKSQSSFSMELNSKLKLLSLQSAEERLFYYLQLHNNEIAYNSVTSLAKELFLTRETLSRLITKLVKQKKVKKIENTITLS